MILSTAGCAGVSDDDPASSQAQAAAVVAVTPAPTPTPSPTPTPTPTATSTSSQTAQTSSVTATCSTHQGVNLSGAEFGSIGDKYGWGYIYPDDATLDYFHTKGVTLIRLPVRWERLQPTPMGALDPDELARLVDLLDRAKTRNLSVIVDLHNYGRFGSDALGSSALPAATLADFWQKMATNLSTHPAFVGYGLMNEPHDMPSTTAWPTAAQLAVNAIRSVDRSKRIYVAGDGWSSAQNWTAANPNLAITDPAGNFRYEAHQYFDKDASGTYSSSYDADGAYPALGADRLQPFVAFLKRTGSKGYIGEYGVPANDTRWLAVMDGFLSAASSAGIDTTYWSAGQWWGSYALSIQPDGGTDKPQMAVLQQHLDEKNGCAL